MTRNTMGKFVKQSNIRTKNRRMSSQPVLLNVHEISLIATMDNQAIRQIPREVAVAYIRHVQELIDVFVASRQSDPSLQCPQLEALLPAMQAMTTYLYFPELSPTSGESDE